MGMRLLLGAERVAGSVGDAAEVIRSGECSLGKEAFSALPWNTHFVVRQRRHDAARVARGALRATHYRTIIPDVSANVQRNTTLLRASDQGALQPYWLGDVGIMTTGIIPGKF